MGLNTNMQIEEMDLESELEELCNELGIQDVADMAGGETPPAPGSEEAAVVARARELDRRLDELRHVQSQYNTFLDKLLDGKPALGVSRNFSDHVEAFERIQNADKEPT